MLKYSQNNIERIKEFIKKPKSLRRVFRTRRRKFLITTLAILVLLTSFQTFLFFREAEAAWYDESWAYRQAMSISGSGSSQTDYQVTFTLNTSTLISAGKMQSDCGDIRIAGIDGTVLNHWFTDCNTSTTDIYTKIPSIPTTGVVVYLYYGNTAAADSSDAANTFEFFDDFPGSSVDTGKWSGDTANFAVSGGLLTGSDTTYRIQSQTSFTGTYIYETRHYTTTYATNGHTSGGFFSTTSNNFGVLIHPTDIWYYRDDGSWSASQGTFESNQWVRQKIVANGSSSDIYLTGETSGTDSATGINNSGLSSEPVTLGTRYDDANQGQSYDADWDWVIVRKFASPEPVPSLGAEEFGPGPAAYWKFDEGYGITFNDATPNGNDLENSNIATLEQQINIISQTYSHNSTSYLPTDNSLGIVRWDANKYSGTVNVYFDVTFRITTHSPRTPRAALYTTGGSQVSGSVLTGGTWQNGNWQHLRSGALTLTDDTDYAVRISTNNSDSTVQIHSARLIIIQSDSSGISETETQIEIGHNETQTSSTATQLTDKKIYNYDSSKFTPEPTVNFEATLSAADPTIEQQINISDHDYQTNSTSYLPTDNSLGIVRWDANKYSGTVNVYFDVTFRITTHSPRTPRAALYTTGGSQVSGSVLTGGTWQNGNWQRRRSSALTLTDDTDYTVRISTNNSDSTVQLHSARLIIIQSDSTKITDTETQIELGNTESQSSSTATRLTGETQYQYTSAEFSPTPTAYFEASIRAADPTIEQQINIIDQAYTTSSTTYVPTDNSLGLIRWDENKYSGETVYFEVVYRQQTHTNFRADVGLYTAAGSQVSGSVLQGATWNNGNWEYRRSGALTLTDDTDYTIRLKSTDSGRTAEIQVARLIVVQTGGTSITDARTQVEIGNNQTGFTNTSYSALTDEKRYMYDQDQFSATPESSGDVEFHATLKIDDSADTVYAQLWNATNSTQVAQISHTGDTNWTLIRGTNIDGDSDWDTTNDDEYIVRIQCSGASCSGNIANAKIVLDQNAAGGLTDVEVVHQQINTLATDTNDAYTQQEFDNEFNPGIAITGGNFEGGTFNYFYEATIKTDAGTGYADLYNLTSASSINNSELTTTSTSYNLQRSSDITSDLPTSANEDSTKDLDARLKNSASSGNTTSVSSTWLVIQASSLATANITAYADLYNLTDSTQVSSSQVSTTNSTWTRVPSSSITLTTAKEYVVRISSSTSNVPVYISNAKLVLDQTAAGGITDVEVVHQQVNALATDADSTYTSKNYLNRFNPSFETTQNSFSGSVLTYYYEATLKTSNAANAGYAQLYNATNTSAITGSEISTTSTSYDRVRSGDITSNMPALPQSAAKVMDTQLKNNSTDTTSSSSSWLIIQVSSLATAGVTAYADLYNLTDGSQVSGSEVSTTGPTWARARSGTITLTTGKEYVVRLSSSIDTVNIFLSNAKIILEQGGGTKVASTEVVQEHINYVATDADTGYTEQGYDNDFDPSNFSAGDGGSVTYYFESTIKTSAGTGYADLYNDTDNASITSSELTTTSTTYERKRSGDITANMPSAVKTMDTRLKNSATNTTSVSSSWVIVQLESTAASGVLPRWNNEEMCVFGKCAFFDGSTAAVLASNADSIDLDGALATAFTFQTWVRVNSDGEANQGEIFEKGTNTYLRITNEGADGLADLEASVDLASANATLAITNGITLNKWHLVTLVYTDDGDDEITLYIDTVDKGSSTNGNGAPAADSNSFILGGDSSNNFHGFIDEFKIYGEARTQDEIKTDFVKGTSSVHGVSTAQGIRPYYDLSDGLVGYWKMDEASADSCTGGSNDSCDSSGNGNDGTWTGTATSAAGKFGNAVTLDGDSDYVDVGDIEFTDQITVAFWANPDTVAAWRGFVGKDNGGANRDFNLRTQVSSGQMGFTVWNDSASSVVASGSNSISADKWQHVVGTYDGKTVRLYVDSILIDSQSQSGNIDNSTQTIHLGEAAATNPYFDGEIDDVRIYNRAFSPSEVDFLYNWAPGPVLYFPFDENTGTTSVNDRSGNENTGTMTGSMISDDWVPGQFGSALDFDGSDDAITLATASDSDVDFNGGESFSTGAWVNVSTMPGSSNQDAIITKWDETSTLRGYRLVVENDDADTTGNFQVELYDESANQAISATGANDTVSENTWYHVSFTFNGGVAGAADDLNLYTNGVLTDGNAANASFLGLEDVAVDFSIADYDATDVVANNTAFTGIIDDVRIYNYVRTPSQIVEDMNAGHPAPGSPVGSPIGYWMFDENYGDTAYDRGSSGNNGDLAGSGGSCPGAGACPSWTSSGKYNNALDFNGTSDYVDMGDQSEFDLERTSPITLEAWVTAGADAGMSIVSKQDNASSDRGYQLQFGSGGKFFMQIINTYSSNGIEVASTNDLNYDDGDWHHVVGTYDGSEDASGVNLYFDGKQIATSTSFNNLNATILNNVGFRVGARTGGAGPQYYNGKIDEAKIYNIELTADQVKLAFNKNSAASFGDVANQDNEGFGGSAPVGWWPMSDNTGTGTDAVTDISGNDNHGDTNGSMTESDWVPVSRAPRYAKSLAGSAIDLDGSNDYLDAGDINAVEGVSALTACAWFKTTDGDGGGLVGKNDLAATPSDRTWILYKAIASDSITFYVTNTAGSWDAQIDGTTTVHDGNWHQTCGVYSGTNDLKLYIDGISEGSITGTEPSTIRSNSQTVKMGVWSNATYLNTLLDDVRIYDYALTQSQIAYVYNRGNPLGHWKLDDCTGTNADDNGSGDNDGTITIGAGGSENTVGTCETSSTAWGNGNPGKRNYALGLDGTDDYVTITDTADLDITGDLSISAWVRRDGGSGAYILSKWSTSGGGGYATLIGSSGEVYCRTDNGSSYTDSYTPTGVIPADSTWHHVAVSRNGTSCRVYIDGLDRTSTANSHSAPSANALNIVLGSRSDTAVEFWNGELDDVKLWNYALTADLVKREYNYGAQFFGPNTGSP